MFLQTTQRHSRPIINSIYTQYFHFNTFHFTLCDVGLYFVVSMIKVWLKSFHPENMTRFRWAVLQFLAFLWNLCMFFSLRGYNLVQNSWDICYVELPPRSPFSMLFVKNRFETKTCHLLTSTLICGGGRVSETLKNRQTKGEVFFSMKQMYLLSGCED